MMALPALLNPDGLVSSEPVLTLRYPNEYKRAMAILGRKEWPTLQKKLSSNEADQVVVALDRYVFSVSANKRAIQNHDAFDCHIWPKTSDMTILKERWDEMNRLRREARWAMRDQSLNRYDLMAILVGKENLCFKRPDTEDPDYDDSDEDYSQFDE